jgi:hypothetical protein
MRSMTLQCLVFKLISKVLFEKWLLSESKTFKVFLYADSIALGIEIADYFQLVS